MDLRPMRAPERAPRRDWAVVGRLPTRMTSDAGPVTVYQAARMLAYRGRDFADSRADDYFHCARIVCDFRLIRSARDRSCRIVSRSMSHSSKKAWARPASVSRPGHPDCAPALEAVGVTLAAGCSLLRRARADEHRVLDKVPPSDSRFAWRFLRSQTEALRRHSNGRA